MQKNWNGIIKKDYLIDQNVNEIFPRWIGWRISFYRKNSRKWSSADTCGAFKKRNAVLRFLKATKI